MSPKFGHRVDQKYLEFRSPAGESGFFRLAFQSDNLGEAYQSENICRVAGVRLEDWDGLVHLASQVVHDAEFR